MLTTMISQTCVGRTDSISLSVFKEFRSVSQGGGTQSRCEAVFCTTTWGLGRVSPDAEKEGISEDFPDC